jgi:hypothetical protein
MCVLFMASTGDPMDALERDKIVNARKMSAEQKLRAGLELFDLNRALMIGSLKSQYPHLDDAALHELFLQRLALSRKLETRL